MNALRLIKGIARIISVANPDRETAKKLALACAATYVYEGQCFVFDIVGYLASKLAMSVNSNVSSAAQYIFQPSNQNERGFAQKTFFSNEAISIASKVTAPEVPTLVQNNSQICPAYLFEKFATNMANETSKLFAGEDDFSSIATNANKTNFTNQTFSDLSPKSDYFTNNWSSQALYVFAIGSAVTLLAGLMWRSYKNRNINSEVPSKLAMHKL